NPTTRIRISLPRAGVASLRVYDVLGREVAALLDGQLGAGKHEVEWNATGFSSGVYVVRLKSSGYVLSRRMMLVR
ncbi:MAG TPA: T9SS type A sorting domain-containing protein, partial [Bacteroidota bacterium]|nr:T9SS type A sorting domain-containing protein [Bacteroidota bacterium]